MQHLIALPRYPLTEMYEKWERKFEPGRGLIDQAFLLCEECSHGKLETVVPPSALYGEHYRTRSAASHGAESALSRFAGFIDKQAERDNYELVIDVGGNDGSLLGYFDEKEMVSVDPNASGPGQNIRCFVEHADLKPFKKRRKLIVSSHTLEHIEHPDAFMERVCGILHHGDYLALQFPSLDLLVRDRRIDHIHHQHVHYYSERSICLLLEKFGLEVVASQFDEMHYGALMVMARRGKGEVLGDVIDIVDVMEAYQTFQEEIACPRVPENAVAFGAALMLPILAYWLQGALDNVEFIADNDKSKNGLRYINLNKRIRSDFNLRYRDVVITGVATKMAARSLVVEAFDQGARSVIVPLHTL